MGADDQRVHWWHVPEIWKDQTVFIIGGGPSLKTADWSKEPYSTILRKFRVIGVNDAYMIGSGIDICAFGDAAWWDLHWHEVVDVPSVGQVPGLAMFPGLVVTNNHRLINEKLTGAASDVLICERVEFGLHRTRFQLAWNRNSGVLAIDLAILLGASRIVLMGFDMKLGGTGESNWHPNLKDTPNPHLYPKYIQAIIRYVEPDLRKRFPHVQVVNATPGTALEVFPIVDLEEEVRNAKPSSKDKTHNRAA